MMGIAELLEAYVDFILKLSEEGGLTERGLEMSRKFSETMKKEIRELNRSWEV